MIYEKCRDILLQEFELIQNAVIIQEKIREAVTERQWTAFEVNLNSMNAIESKLQALENEREQIFSVLRTLLHQQNFSEHLDEKGQFYALIACLPKAQRDDLVSIYRSLKLEAVKLRIANDSLSAYINGIKSALRDFFDLAFIERGGKTYTKEGKFFSHEMRSMVLNQSF